MPPLKNIRHENFCLHYAETANATESYRNAGYKAKTENAISANATRLLKNDKVQQRLRELAEEMNEAKIADIREVHERLTAILRMETMEEHIVIEGCGEGESVARIVKTAPRLSDVIKAGVELAKMKGGYDSKLQVEVTVPVFGGEESLAD